MSEQMPVWERRYRAPVVSMPRWARGAPERLVFWSTESGVYQVHVWDRASGVRRRVTDHPVGVIFGALTPDGERVLFWQDETGSEAGQWYAEPFAGGAAEPFLPGIAQGWNQGLAQRPGLVAAGISDAGGFSAYVSIDGEPPKEIWRSTESISIGGAEHGRDDLGGLSADGTMLALEHAEHGDSMHPAVRVVDARTGSTIAEQVDEGLALHASCWSPVPGDQRLVVTHEREGEERPAVWHLTTGSWTDLDLGLSGPVEAVDWWPDASALLVVHNDEGRDRLHRYDLSTGSLEPIEHGSGSIGATRVRPDGDVWFRLSAGEHAPVTLDRAGAEVVAAEGERAPAGRPFTSWHFDNGEGDRVHGFYVTPEAEGPFPVMMFVHGGPTGQDVDAWDPEVQTYVDMGFAVGMVNYRGSTGYGRAWRDRLIGDIGGPELVDVNAGLADLAARGIADPDRAVVGGWSWGGYITVMELCKHPDMWLAGVAGVPVGDYELSYEDLSPELQAYDRALLGGTPDEVPELMRDRNPIYFTDRVQAPVIFLIGENDSRCPFRQAMAFVEKLRERNHPHEVVLFGTGHGSFDIDEEVRQMRSIMAFLERYVPGVTVP
ncbi:MAG TPA: prolyl oligopeptidase family serine peptidase [Actinomycetota bacterium]|jgi:dienelactone hydrolase